MELNKALGSNSFSSGFFKYYLRIIGPNVCNTVQEFFIKGDVPVSWQATFVILVLKRSNPTLASHFRSISLCNTIYQLVAKIITLQIKSVLHKLIFKEQVIFIFEKGIIDNAILGQKLMHFLCKVCPAHSLIAIKLDMEGLMIGLIGNTCQICFMHLDF